MAKQGMSTTLVIIVAAVVILVTALVILTIFGSSITPLGSLAEAKNHCNIIGNPSCQTTGQLPPTWEINTIRFNNELTSCSTVCNTKICSSYSSGEKFLDCK